MNCCNAKINLEISKNSDPVANSHKFLIRWKNYFSQLLNSRRVSEVRHVEIYTTEKLVPDHSVFEVEITIANLKIYTSLGTNKPLNYQTQFG
jgi:hypothetical protein